MLLAAKKTMQLKRNKESDLITINDSLIIFHKKRVHELYSFFCSAISDFHYPPNASE